jgi:cytochrome c-type biogenesis protein CcmH/NrfG
LRRWVVRLYGMGFAVMVASLGWTGLHGAPRKTPYAVPSSEAFGYSAAMAAHGVGGLLAVSGTVLFAWVVLRALWRREAMRDLFALATVPMPTSAAGPRDVRRRAIAIAVSATVLVGATIAAWSQQAVWRGAATDLLARMPAIDKLSHVTERRRMEVAARFEQGVTMLRAGEFEYAMTAFHRVLLLDPQMPEAHANLGFALIGLGEFAAARDFFQSALALRDTQTNAYFGLAEAYEGLGDIEMALGAMRTFSHLAAPDDRFRIRAESAIWEWEAKLATSRGDPSASPGKASNNKKTKKGPP